jgi:archaeosine-15-forming tRNA-guanine transglycosylase
MITIELLRVMFEAEREQDEARFADLFAAHIARHEQRRRSDDDVVVTDEDRNYGGGGAW